MAQVTSSTHQHIYVVMSHLLQDWTRSPQAVEEINDWDLDAQIAYIEEWAEEWAPDNQLLELLHAYERDGVLTEDQTARYQELVSVVQENRPLLDKLREQ